MDKHAQKLGYLWKGCALSCALALAVTPAMAQVAGTMAAVSGWLIGVVVAAAVVIIILAAIALATGRASLVGLLFLIVGIAVATHPEEVAALLTS